MPSYKPRITVYTDEETNQKLAYIAKSENRSSSNYTEYLIKKEIKSYEAEHGEIILDTLKKGLQEAREQIIDNPELNHHEKLIEIIKKSSKEGLNCGENLADAMIKKQTN